LVKIQASEKSDTARKTAEEQRAAEEQKAAEETDLEKLKGRSPDFPLMLTDLNSRLLLL
jgi:hypothetical protein